MIERTTRPPWMEQGTMLERVGKAIVLTLVSVVVIYPFITVVATSLGTEAEITRNGGLILIWPSQISFNAYKTIFTGGIVTKSVMVSIGITVVGTILSLITTIGLAYALSRPIIFGKAILVMSLLTLLFVPGIIPNYLAVKQLGLLNTYSALIPIPRSYAAFA